MFDTVVCAFLYGSCCLATHSTSHGHPVLTSFADRALSIVSKLGLKLGGDLAVGSQTC